MLASLLGCLHSPLCGQRKERIPEAYLVPQRLYAGTERLDFKRVRKLILQEKLAPCYPGVEEARPGQELEECPICFLLYPVLNTSRCCNKRVCTECFLQVQTTTLPNHVPCCPFCKEIGYTTKFVGAKPEAEKEQERVEEQKVLEARIREREEETQRDQERALQRINEQHTRQQQQQQEQQAAGSGQAGEVTTPSTVASASASLRVNTRNAFSTPRSGTGASMAQPLPSPSPSTPHRQGPVASPALVPAAAGSTSATRPARGSPLPLPNTHSTSLTGMSGGSGAGGVHGRHDSSAAEHAAGARGSHQARGQNDALRGSRRYRLTDYVPMGVVDMGALGVEDINDLMLEQALYDSLRAAHRQEQAESQAVSSLLHEQQQQQEAQAEEGEAEAAAEEVALIMGAAPCTIANTRDSSMPAGRQRGGAVGAGLGVQPDVGSGAAENHIYAGEADEFEIHGGASAAPWQGEQADSQIHSTQPGTCAVQATATGSASCAAVQSDDLSGVLISSRTKGVAGGRVEAGAGAGQAQGTSASRPAPASTSTCQEAALGAFKRGSESGAAGVSGAGAVAEAASTCPDGRSRDGANSPRLFMACVATSPCGPVLDAAAATIKHSTIGSVCGAYSVCAEAFVPGYPAASKGTEPLGTIDEASSSLQCQSAPTAGHSGVAAAGSAPDADADGMSLLSELSGLSMNAAGLDPNAVPDFGTSMHHAIGVDVDTDTECNSLLSAPLGSAYGGHDPRPASEACAMEAGPLAWQEACNPLYDVSPSGSVVCALASRQSYQSDAVHRLSQAGPVSREPSAYGAMTAPGTAPVLAAQLLARRSVQHPAVQRSVAQGLPPLPQAARAGGLSRAGAAEAAAGVLGLASTAGAGTRAANVLQEQQLQEPATRPLHEAEFGKVGVHALPQELLESDSASLDSTHTSSSSAQPSESCEPQPRTSSPASAAVQAKDAPHAVSAPVAALSSQAAAVCESQGSSGHRDGVTLVTMAQVVQQMTLYPPAVNISAPAAGGEKAADSAVGGGLHMACMMVMYGSAAAPASMPPVTATTVENPDGSMQLLFPDGIVKQGGRESQQGAASHKGACACASQRPACPGGAVPYDLQPAYVAQLDATGCEIEDASYGDYDLPELCTFGDIPSDAQLAVDGEGMGAAVAVRDQALQAAAVLRDKALVVEIAAADSLAKAAADAAGKHAHTVDR